MGIAKYNDKNLPAGKDAAKNFYEWARKAAKEHGKDSVISTYDKSSSNKSYVLQYFGTWGELLTAARSNAVAEKVTDKEIKAIDFKVLKPEEYKKQQEDAAAKKKAEEDAAKKAEAEKAAYEKANRKSDDPKFIEWIKTQYHDPDDEISNFNKLTLKYVVPSGIKTWGDWYKYAGLDKPPVKPKEKPKEKTAAEKEQDAINKGRAEYYYGGGQQAAEGPSTYQIGVGISQAKQYLDAAKPGTKEYDQYLAAYKAGLDKLNEVNNAAVKKTKETQAKAAAEKRQGLVEALQRANDYGTPKQKQDAQAALDAFDKKNPDAATYKPDSGTTKTEVPKPTVGKFTIDKDGNLLKDGKKYTGEYVVVVDGKTRRYQMDKGTVKNETYEVIAKDGTVKTYDLQDKEVKTSGTTTKPTTTSATTSGSTTKPTTSGVTPGTTTKPTTSGVTPGVTPGTTSGTTSGVSGGYTPTPSMGPGSDPKGIWVSALKATFKTGIDDPKQKAEIDKLIETAKAQKWNEATFMEAMKNTKWWQATLPTLRQFFIDSHDPRNAATFAQTMLNKIDSVQASMEKLGIKINDIDPVTGKVIDNTEIIKGIAAQALQNGWDDNQIQEHLATKSEVIFTGGGALGSYITQIKQQALNYGISLDANQLATINRDLLNPQDGKDAQWYLNNIKQQAIDANPAFAASLKEGRTLYDVTSAYRKQMADLLEVDSTNITWNDLMSKVINKDKGTANTFADFTKLVKQDPLWQRTKNAKETYSNTALDLMKQFGFMG